VVQSSTVNCVLHTGGSFSVHRSARTALCGESERESAATKASTVQERKACSILRLRSDKLCQRVLKRYVKGCVLAWVQDGGDEEEGGGG
jgi:hypothetical protein